MNLEDWFLKGKTAQEYVDSMDHHKEDLVFIYENFDVSTKDHPFFEQLQKRNLRALILTEDWCGDAMMNIPIFLRLAEASHIHTHFLLRDENPDLMDQYLTNGTSRSIPKIIVINSKGEEICNWGPRAPELQQFIDESSASLPQKDDEEFKAKQKEMLRFVIKAYRGNQDLWNYVYEDLKKTLKY